VKSYHASVVDTMKIKLFTFDHLGELIDIGGHFQIELTVNIQQ
jgi:hypothetical protein